MSAVPLFSAQDLIKTFGVKTLFEGITFSISTEERVALIGPNGSGKSTLLKIIASIEEPDSGMVYPRRNLHCAYVPQEDKFEDSQTVTEVLINTLVKAGHEAYEIERKVELALEEAGFKNKNSKISSLSGGWKKRLAILRGLVLDPELLLLDEPTNHLDIEGVLWLENLLNKSPAAIVFVSHDRYFITRLATRVFEINRRYPRGYFSANGDYGDFLEARELYLEGLKQTQDTLANKVRREVAWLRKTARAQTTKSKHRTAEAIKLVDEFKNSQYVEKRAQLEFASTNKKSKDLIKVENITKSMGNRTLFKDISITLSPGVRLGIVGPNGSGKTTFVKTLLGDIQPDSGRVAIMPNLRINFFDQARKNLDKTVTLKRALAPSGGDSVIFNSKSLHVASWAKRFLFSNEQLGVPVSSLSGGEQARLLLAQLMLQEADVIFFDEPTNDLDIGTLEVLEESFCEFPGSIVLVTHDRYLLDRTATTVLGLSPSGGSFYASYFQWEEAFQSENDTYKSSQIASLNMPPAVSNPKPVKAARKLTQEEQKELKNIESKILKAEKALEALNEQMTAKNQSGDVAAITQCCQDIAKQQKVIEDLYSRWQELESK
jgi:ATP-binding cassette subfamily F protein uup